MIELAFAGGRKDLLDFRFNNCGEGYFSGWKTAVGRGRVEGPAFFRLRPRDLRQLCSIGQWP